MIFFKKRPQCKYVYGWNLSHKYAHCSYSLIYNIEKVCNRHMALHDCLMEPPACMLPKI